MESLKLDEFSFEDYEQISKNDRCELIFGEIVMMASPSYIHQVITGNIFNILKNAMKAKKNPCIPVISPYDIKLKKGFSENVVQPDVMVFCKKNNIKKSVNNIPTIVFEVLSPSTSTNDYSSKKELYELFGIKEYYIISPEYKTVQKFILRAGKLKLIDTFVEKQQFTIDSLKEEIEVKELFDE